MVPTFQPASSLAFFKVRAPLARKVFGRSNRCKFAHAFLREYSYERTKLAQLPWANLASFSHLSDCASDELQSGHV